MENHWGTGYIGRTIYGYLFTLVNLQKDYLIGRTIYMVMFLTGHRYFYGMWIVVISDGDFYGISMWIMENFLWGNGYIGITIYGIFLMG